MLARIHNLHHASPLPFCNYSHRRFTFLSKPIRDWQTYEWLGGSWEKSVSRVLNSTPRRPVLGLHSASTLEDVLKSLSASVRRLSVNDSRKKRVPQICSI